MDIVLLKSYTISDKELYADEVPIFVGVSPFGHLEVKYSFILTRLNLLNETVNEIHACHVNNLHKRKNHEYVSREESLRPIVKSLCFSSDLKILTDELISLNYILHYYYLHSSWPTEIQIDCIGAYLNLANKDGFEPFNNHTDTVEKINHIGNAIKHSFINSEIL